MKAKLVSESISMANIRNIWKYGGNINKEKEEAINAFKEFALLGAEVHLTPTGLTVTSKSGDVYKVDKKENVFILPMGSVVHLTSEEAKDLYDIVLKNSFENEI
jgi:hypothetical protein